MGQYKKLWYTLMAVLVVTFGILGYYGTEVYKQAPPIPEQYVTEDGQTIITRDDILQGQSAWQTTGGMQLGSVWGHGAYQAPDWTAEITDSAEKCLKHPIRCSLNGKNPDDASICFTQFLHLLTRPVEKSARNTAESFQTGIYMGKSPPFESSSQGRKNAG